jgi:hypothetical protein
MAARQNFCRLLLRDENGTLRKQIRSPDVVSVFVTVNDMTDGLGGHFGDGLQIFVAEVRERIHGDYALRRHQEDGVVQAIRHPVESASNLLNEITLLRRNCWRCVESGVRFALLSRDGHPDQWCNPA